MTDNNTPGTGAEMSITEGSRGNVNLIYILYIISVVLGVTGLIGVIMAYVGRGDADPMLRTHYDNQIGIF